MSQENYVNIVVGCKIPANMNQYILTDSVTRYDPVSGKPYTKKLKSTIYKFFVLDKEVDEIDYYEFIDRCTSSDVIDSFHSNDGTHVIGMSVADVKVGDIIPVNEDTTDIEEQVKKEFVRLGIPESLVGKYVYHYAI